MKTMNILTLSAALLALLVSCDRTSIQDQEEPDDNPRKQLELSTRSFEFIRMGDAFSFDFIDRINAGSDKDYIISPLSMQFLLGMLLDGAQGETADEISRVLGYGAGEVDAVNEFCQSMMQQLPQMDKKTDISIANAIFVDDGWPLLDSYKETVGRYYQAEIDNLDFCDNEGSLRRINGWCAEHTNGLIPKVLDEVDPGMLAYLLNALYFKGQWASKFQASSTVNEAFTDESGSISKVPMMKQLRNHSYTENEIFKAVRLPYGNGAYSMTVFLPKAGHKVAEITSALKTMDWGAFDNRMIPCEVDLWLPKFETKFHIHLNELLSQMGMPSAFNGELADFKAMSPYALCLSFVQQDAIIKVDEEGTEAAAISSAGVAKTTAIGPEKHAVFHADHPFLYLITESSSDVVLFAGRFAGKK